jgi:imidazoleglycerol-phosphate dehydratase
MAMYKKPIRKFGKFRKAQIKRKTFEVDIKGEFNVDGSGKESIKTPIEPLNHLLTLFAFHGLFDLQIEAKGDLEHHIIEDIGIALGKAFKESLGSKAGINRYGSFSLVMDETVVEANIDISGRPNLLKYSNAALPALGHFDNTHFTYEDAEEFLKAFTQHAGISLVYIIKTPPSDLHHLLEALFKAMGKALEQATRKDPRRDGIPSTKGIID